LSFFHVQTADGSRAASHGAAPGSASEAAAVRHGQQQQQQQQSGEGSGGSWKDKMNGWFGGDAGLPMDGWLTTCCAQVSLIFLLLLLLLLPAA
jgi:hypothetical protein